MNKAVSDLQFKQRAREQPFFLDEISFSIVAWSETQIIISIESWKQVCRFAT